MNKCKKCDLYKTRTNIVYGVGKPCGIMIIGEAPGGTEDEEGIPFCGKCGKMMDYIIEEAGLRRKDLFITNTVKCRPVNNGKDRPPSIDELDACYESLVEEIKENESVVIILLGNTATRYLLEEYDGITKLRGKVFKVGKKLVVPSYHPSYLIRSHSEKLVFESIEDFKLAKKLLEDRI